MIALDPRSPRGYEMKHAALHKARKFRNAVGALETMFSEIPDLDTQGEPYPCFRGKNALFTFFRQSIPTGTSTRQTHAQQFAVLFNGLSVVCHAYSSTLPLVLSTIELNMHLHSKRYQSLLS